MSPDPSAPFILWYLLTSQVGLRELTWAGDVGRVSAVSEDLVWAPTHPFSASFTLSDQLGVDHVDEATCAASAGATPISCQTGLRAERGFDMTCILPAEVAADEVVVDCSFRYTVRVATGKTEHDAVHNVTTVLYTISGDKQGEAHARWPVAPKADWAAWNTAAARARTAFPTLLGGATALGIAMFGLAARAANRLNSWVATPIVLCAFALLGAPVALIGFLANAATTRAGYDADLCSCDSVAGVLVPGCLFFVYALKRRANPVFG